MAKLWPGHDSGTHTRTPTHRDKTLYALPLFYGGKKLAGVGMFGDRGMEVSSRRPYDQK